MLHTYSLIHDDLPALDNDDLRRGKPTCHVVFGEAIAILAGDALQTRAFEVLAGLDTPPAATVQIIGLIANAVGTVDGMIGGQVLDIESEHLKPTPELVEAIHRAKTGALIRVSVVAGGVYAGATAEDVARLDIFGRKAGLAFQIVDDVLDMTVDSAQLGKTAGKDQATEKATWPAVFGIEQSQRDAAHADRRSLRRARALRQPRRRAQVRGPLPGRAQELKSLGRIFVLTTKSRCPIHAAVSSRHGWEIYKAEIGV